MKIYGYVRISTPKQNIERQVRNILARYPDAFIVREIFTGTKFLGRKELDKILKLIKSGDCIVFDSVSRMSRNAYEGCELYEELYYKGIDLIFLKEPYVNTQVFKDSMNKQVSVLVNTGNAATDTLINSIIAALNEYTMDLAKQQIRKAFEQAEKEVQDLRQRTREGIETARLNGKQIGQKAGVTLVTKKSIEAKEKIKKFNKTFGGPLTNEETWKLVGVSKTSFYKYKEELLEEMHGEI